MNKALLNSLTAAEQRFLTETSRDSLADLDEDEVLDLHTRARRMRDKHVTTYRRAAAAAVGARGGRGASYEENQRDRAKAETFETALARVSRRVGVLAAHSAAELRRERLDTARTESAHPRPSADGTTPQPASRPRGAKKTTGGMKKDASTRAQGARRQAKRDKG
jgi:hypothetical protein